MGIERLAGDFYTQAGIYFSLDRHLREFLESSAEDEAWHYDIMSSAWEHMDDHPDIRPAISIDPENRERIESVFLCMQSRLFQGTLTKELLSEGIADAEFSEWNDIFLYVVNSLKQRMKEFNHVAPRIENHKRNILHFLEEMPGGLPSIDRLKKTSSVWREKILIVEDDEALREILGVILAGEGVVASAPNGRIGAEMARSAYFRVILSDIDMPEMDGFQMFETLRNEFPTIPSRFIFMSGNSSHARTSFFVKHGIDFLPKPSSINEIRACVLRNLRKGMAVPSQS